MLLYNYSKRKQNNRKGGNEMKAKKYIETVKRINNKRDLERLLSYIENDTEISARKYESIRTFILKKMYA